MTMIAKITAMLCGLMLMCVSGTIFADKGTVKWFDVQKGYGFITPDDGGDDVFLHFSAMQDDYKTLKEGQCLRYEVTKSKAGRGSQRSNSLQAINVNKC